MVSGVHFRGAGTCYVCWCWVGKGWDVSTIHFLGDTLSGCVTWDPRVGPLGACAIHLAHPFCMGSRILLSAWFAWCLVFVLCMCNSPWEGWDVSTIRILGDTFSGYVTQDPRVGPSEAYTIHPFCMIACMGEAYSVVHVGGYTNG